MNCKSPVGICILKGNNKKTRTRCEICSKLTKKTPERRQASLWCLYCLLWTYFTPCSDVCIVNFEQVNAVWVSLSSKTCTELNFNVLCLRSTSNTLRKLNGPSKHWRRLASQYVQQCALGQRVICMVWV